MHCVVQAAWVATSRSVVCVRVPDLPGDAIAFMNGRDASRLPRVGQRGVIAFFDLNYPEAGMADRHWEFSS